MFFCGINGIRRNAENNYKFMTKETLNSLVSQIVLEGWNPRLEFAMHGEPTMHPDFAGMIAVARKAAPKLHIMMTSNGGGLLKKPGPVQNIEQLFEAGLNVLALDNYESVSIVPKICDALDTEEFANIMSLLDIQVYDYPKDAAGNPHRRRKPNERVLTVVKDISVAVKGTHARLANHAGAAAKKNDSMAGQRCAKPFREMSIRWDGNVAICCDDWRGTFKAGNVIDDGLIKVWNSPAMQAARRHLYHGKRTFGPCKGCDARSYRVGLLPDKKGNRMLPKPTPDDVLAVERACLGKPYTAPVLRPWETK